MSKNVLHLDLLKEDEHFSSSPIRLRVLFPMFAILAAFGFLVWWGVLFSNIIVIEQQKKNCDAYLEQNKKVHSEFVKWREGVQASIAENEQIVLYRNSVNRYADFLAGLGVAVSSDIQLISIYLPSPRPYDLQSLQPRARGKAPVAKVYAQTTTTEPCIITLSGRTTAAAPVDTLRDNLQHETFSNVVTSAEIPTGTFRQDNFSRESTGNRFLFDIQCKCIPRRFE